MCDDENCPNEITILSTANETVTNGVFHQFEVSERKPVYILFPVPTRKDELVNPFGIVMVSLGRNMKFFSAKMKV